MESVGGAIALVIISLAMVLIIKNYLFQISVVASGSMEPTFQIGDRILVMKAARQRLQRGDVVTFEPLSRNEPTRRLLSFGRRPATQGSSGRQVLKRIIGCPGDVVEMRHGTFWVNGSRMDALVSPSEKLVPDFPRHEVAPNRLFVVGDDLLRSEDSRHFGDIAPTTIVGRAVLRVWPPGRVQTAT